MPEESPRAEVDLEWMFEMEAPSGQFQRADRGRRGGRLSRNVSKTKLFFVPL